MTRAQLLVMDLDPRPRRALLPRPAWSSPSPVAEEGLSPLVCERFFDRYGGGTVASREAAGVGGPAALQRYAELASLGRALTRPERAEFHALQDAAAEEIGRAVEARILSPLRMALATLSRVNAQGLDHEAPPTEDKAPKPTANKKARSRW